MPASRSARAMIFAPRSWPSSPGLATTTRILRLVSALVANAGGESSQWRALGGFDRSLRFELALCEPLAQDLLVELADTGLRHSFYEGELVGQPPLRHERHQVVAQLLGRTVRALA